MIPRYKSAYFILPNFYEETYEQKCWTDQHLLYSSVRFSIVSKVTSSAYSRQNRRPNEFHLDSQVSGHAKYIDVASPSVALVAQ